MSGDTPDLVGIGDRYLRCSGFNEVFRMPITVQSWVRVRTVLTLSVSRPLLANIAQDTVNDDSYGTLSNTRPSYYTWSIHWYISLIHVSGGRIRQDASSKVSTSGSAYSSATSRIISSRRWKEYFDLVTVLEHSHSQKRNSAGFHSR